MCRCCDEKNGGGNNFYYQYLQQHAQMLRWVQNLHGNASYFNQPNAGYYQCCSERANSRPYRPSTKRYYAYYSAPYYPEYFAKKDKDYFEERPYAGYCRCCSENANSKFHDPSTKLHYANDSAPYYPEYFAKKEEDNSEGENPKKDGDSSGDELVLNVDAILAMRAERAKNSNSEEESFELIDAVTEEEFEYVELNPFGRLDKKHGVKQEPDTNADALQEKEVKKYLYGEKADMIAGLETSIAINFERLCDIHQPHLWPVLPLRL